MRYVISGKSDSFHIYVRNNKLQKGVDAIYVRKREIFDKITDIDTIVLLYGWWGKKWAKEALLNILEIYPCIHIEFLDGMYGAKERLDMTRTKSTVTRFDLIDFE